METENKKKLRTVGRDHLNISPTSKPRLHSGKTVLIIRSNHPAFEPRVLKTLKTLQESAIPFVVIGWDRNTTAKIPQINLENGELYLFRLKTPIGKPLISLVLPLWWIYVFAIALSKPKTVLHSCDFDTLIPSLFLKIVAKRKLVYEIFDFYSDRLPEKTLIRRTLGFIEKFLARFADIVILADDQRKEQVKGLKTQFVDIIYNSPPSILTLHHKPKVYENHFTLFYCGTMDFRRGILDVCRAVEELSGTKLLLAGYSGPHYNELLSLIAGFNNTTFIGPLNYDKVLDFSCRSDALFALYDPSVPNYRFASPNKLFEAMMCSRPIIVSGNTLMANRVNKHSCGIVVNYGDNESLKKAIQYLKDNPNFAKKLGDNGRKAYDTVYSWTKMKERLLRIYNQILME